MFQLGSMHGQTHCQEILYVESRDELMGDMDTKEARLAVLGGIRVFQEAIVEEDLAVEMVGDKLS